MNLFQLAKHGIIKKGLHSSKVKYEPAKHKIRLCRFSIVYIPLKLNMNRDDENAAKILQFRLHSSKVKYELKSRSRVDAILAQFTFL